MPLASVFVMEPGILITVVLTCVGAIVWAVRVEGRVNGHDKVFIDLSKLLDERHTAITTRLERIEAKIDTGLK